VPVLSWLLIAGRNTPRSCPQGMPSKDVPRMHPGSSPSRTQPKPPKGKGSFAQPVHKATTRFPSKPDWPNPQSQSFSRSYGSGLPTSLTYINLSTRGCSPRRPDADMGTNWCEGISFLPPDFQVPYWRSADAARTAALFGAKTLSPNDSVHKALSPLTRKDNSSRLSSWTSPGRQTPCG